VYSERANPTLFQSYGTFLDEATVHTYTFDLDKYFVGLRVAYQTNSNGFKIPMGLDVFESTELVQFNFPALQNIRVTVGDPNPPVYDVSTRWLPDTGVCDTVEHTSTNFWGESPYGNDPNFSMRYKTG